MATQTWDTVSEYDAGSYSNTRAKNGDLELAKNPQSSGNTLNYTVEYHVDLANRGDLVWEARDSGGTTVKSGSTTMPGDNTWTTVGSFSLDVWTHPNPTWYFSYDAGSVDDTVYYRFVEDASGDVVFEGSQSLSGGAISDTGSSSYYETYPHQSSGSWNSETRSWSESRSVAALSINSTIPSGGIDITVSNGSGSTATVSASGGSETVEVSSLPASTQASLSISLSTNDTSVTPELHSVTINAGYPPATLDSVSAGDRQADIDWTQQDDQTDGHFEVRRSQDGSVGAGVAQVDVQTQTSTVTETLTWGAASDWDSVVSENMVAHDGDDEYNPGTVVLGGYDGFEDADYTSSPSWSVVRGSGTQWTIQNVTQHDGTSGNVLQGKTTGEGAQVLLMDNSNAADVSLEAPLYRSGTNYFDGGFVWRYQDNNNYYYLRTASGGSQAVIEMYSAGNLVDVWSGSVTNGVSNQWAVWKVEHVGDTINLYTKPPGGSYTQEASVTDTGITSSGRIGATANAADVTTNNYEGRFAYYRAKATSGFIETASKSFSEPVTPDLKNLTYNLNGGGIDIVVTGSPGTSSSETIRTTLGGSSSYSLSWASSHSNFKIRIELTSTGVTQTPPQISNVDLTGSYQTTSISSYSYSYTDSGLLDGTEYDYTIARVSGSGDTTYSTTVSDITDLPAPTGLSESNVSTETVDFSWTNNANNGTYSADIREYLLAGTRFSENFDDGTLDGWTASSGSWSISNGLLKETSGNADSRIYHPVEISPDRSTTWTWDWRRDGSLWSIRTYVWETEPTALTGEEVFLELADDGSVNLKYNNSGGSGGQLIANYEGFSHGNLDTFSVTYDGVDTWTVSINGTQVTSGTHSVQKESQALLFESNDETSIDNITIESSGSKPPWSTEITGISRSSPSTTISSLLNGEVYEGRVRIVTEDAQSEDV